MLAGRLVSIARDILSDYRKFGIIELLTQAQNLAAQKGSLPDSSYQVQASSIRTKAQSILNNTIVGLYPGELRSRIFSINFSQVTPERAAQIVLHGVNENKNLGMTSSELAIYVQNANLLSSELSALITAGGRLGIEPISVPENMISLDVEIPRSAVENKTTRLFSFYTRFSSLMSYFNEITVGDRASPELCYTSTTDPVTGFTLAFAAAGGFLTFYKQLLEVAEKHIGIHKTLKDLRQSGLETPKEMEIQLEAMIDRKFDEAVDKAIASMTTSADETRIKEIKTGIRKDGKHVLEAIANGATVTVTVECLDRLHSLIEYLPEQTSEALSAESRKRQILEQRIRDALSSLGERAPALLSDQREDHSR